MKQWLTCRFEAIEQKHQDSVSFLWFFYCWENKLRKWTEDLQQQSTYLTLQDPISNSFAQTSGPSSKFQIVDMSVLVLDRGGMGKARNMEAEAVGRIVRNFYSRKHHPAADIGELTALPGYVKKETMSISTPSQVSGKASPLTSSSLYFQQRRWWSSGSARFRWRSRGAFCLLWSGFATTSVELLKWRVSGWLATHKGRSFYSEKKDSDFRILFRFRFWVCGVKH